MRVSRIWAALLAVLLAGGGSMASAQETTGAVSGTVKDSSGGVIPGATIALQGGVVNRFEVSDGNGQFLFAAVPPGTYRITATLSGFAPQVAEGVVVSIGRTTPIDVALKAGGISEQVTVTATAAVIDTAQTTIQTNVSAALIDTLPKGTNMSSLFKLAPSARAEPLSGQFQIDGASGSENSFVLDGLETSNFRTGVLNTNNNLPFELIEDIQIKTSGFNAEFGGATGGVISVVTRSGTNAFRGNLGMQWDPSSLEGDPRQVLNSYRSGTGAAFVQINEYLQPKKDTRNSYYPLLAIGGPIAKNKAFFFASYSPQIFDEKRTTEYFTSDPRTRTQTGAETYTRRRTGQYLQGRVDYQPTNTLRVTGTYTWNPYIEDGVFPQSQISIGGAVPSANFGGNTGVLRGNALTSKQGARRTA